MRWSVSIDSRGDRGGFITLVAALGIATAACSSAPAHPVASPPPAAPPPAAALPSVAASAAAPRPEDSPPPSGISPDWKFPTIEEQTLESGLMVRSIQRHTLPLVQLELVVKSGSATDGSKPGLAGVAGELLKAGGAGKWASRALLDAAESLGSSLDVTTDRDSTRVTMAVTSDHFAAALDVLAAVVTKPRFDASEFTKLKRREMDRVTSLTKTSASWVSSMVLYRELYAAPTGVHPYSRYDSTAHDIDGLTLQDCRAWHRREVTPKNSFLVVAGDVDPKTAGEEARRAFGAWKGDAPEAPAFNAPFPPKALSIHLVDRPSSPQAEVYLATLGPERKSPEWPALRATNQILGGGVAGRLFLDVREKQSLAYRTGSSVEALAHGPVPIVLSAGTQTAKAGLTLQALLAHFDGIGTKLPPTDDETAIATRFLSDTFLVRVDTVASIAGLTADLGIFGLPNDYYDTYRAAVRSVTKDTALELATRYFQPGKVVVVVAGDAARLAKPLSHFGPVSIVDAGGGFVTKSTLPYDPTATVELPRIDGT